MKKWSKCILIFTLLLTLTLKLSVQAGDINGNEANLLGVASGTFEYNGNTYVAKSEYVAELEGMLSSDGVNLTAAQAGSLISQIFSNVETGVNQGYLTQVGGDDTTQSGSSDTENPKDNPNEVQPDSKSGNQTENKDSTGSKADATEAAEKTEAAGNESEGKRLNEETQAKKKVLWVDSDDLEVDKNQTEQKSSENKVPESEIFSENSKKSQGESDSNLYDENQKKNNPNGGLFAFITENRTSVIVICGIVILAVLGVQIAKRIKRKVLGGRVHIDNYIDIHSHILPGVDDGAKNMEESMKMADIAYENGIRKMIATPHYHIGHHHKSMEELQDIFEKTKSSIQKRHPDFELYLGNELFYFDGIVDKIENKKVYTLAGSKYVLVEFNIEETYSQILNGITKIVRAGYVPVIAHVERYKNVVEDKRNLQELRKAGAFLQMNVKSVKDSFRFIKYGYIDLLGTDCHNEEKRSPQMKEAIQILSTFLTHEEIVRLLVKQPGRIIDNKYIER